MAVIPGSEPIRDLDPIVVSGVQPGPGMWKVSNGENVLWILGTVSPLPKRMQWESRDVDTVLLQAREVIWSPVLTVKADVGFFRGMMLVPKALGARKNPDEATLQQVVPADMYARWQLLKKQYIGRNSGIEKWRPIFAATELYKEAIDDAGLTQSGITAPVVKRAIKAHDLVETSPNYELLIDDPKVALNEFRASRLDDLDCFGKTLQRIETDLDAMTLRANAWAVGDIEGLRGLPYTDQNEACIQAGMRSSVVRKRSEVDIEAAVRAIWLKAAHKALAGNKVTFAMLPMRELLTPDGYLAELASRGYEVEAPSAATADVEEKDVATPKSVDDAASIYD